MEWTINNVACITVWEALRVLGQIRELQLFKTAGKKKMKNLTFYADTKSGDPLDKRAKALAIVLDKFFRFQAVAEYESNVTLTKALSSMTKVLKDETKTIADLAAVADKAYQFFGEEDI